MTAPTTLPLLPVGWVHLAAMENLPRSVRLVAGERRFVQGRVTHIGQAPYLADPEAL